MDERRPATRELIVIDLQEARERPVTTLGAEAIDAVLWQGASDPARLIVSVRERKARPLRVWQVSVDTGEQRPLTNDASDYLVAGLSHDGQRVIAARVESSWSLWVAPLTKTSAARQVDSGMGAFDLLESVAWTPDGEVVYTHAGSGNLDLWRIDPDTGTRRQLTSDLAADYHAAVSPDGRTVVFASDRSGSATIWATPIDAERPRRLTSGGDLWPSTSPDGRWVVFQRGMADAAIESVWRVPLAGGEAERIGPPHSYRPVVSPDARSIAHYWMNPEQWALATTLIGSSLPGRSLPISRAHGKRVVRWSPDGKPWPSSTGWAASRTSGSTARWTTGAAPHGVCRRHHGDLRLVPRRLALGLDTNPPHWRRCRVGSRRAAPVTRHAGHHDVRTVDDRFIRRYG